MKTTSSVATTGMSGTLTGIPGFQFEPAPGKELTVDSTPPVRNPLKIVAGVRENGGGGVKGTGVGNINGVPIVSVLTATRCSV